MRRPIAVHPLLLAATPVLFLWSQNVNEVPFGRDVLAPLAVTIGVVAVVHVVAGMAVRDHRRGALAASGIAAVFLTFGYAAEALDIHHGYVLAAALVLVGAITVVAARVDDLDQPTRLLNGLALILMVVAAGPAVARAATTSQAEATDRSRGSTDVLDSVEATRSSTRDIYYLVLDRYARADTLAREFGYDNSGFLDFLGDRGFTVADDSLANYPKTAHSLAASLNLTYIDRLIDVHAVTPDSWTPIYDLLGDHAVGRFLTGHGYRYLHVGSWFDPLGSSPLADTVYHYGSAGEFTRSYEQTTAWPTIRALAEDLAGRTSGPQSVREYRRDSTLHQLEVLDRLAAGTRNDTPEFVFAPITLPHGPYTMTSTGTPLSEDEVDRRSLRQNYLGHLRYANHRLRRLLTRLLDGPAATDPIVILQADEGPNPAVFRGRPNLVPTFQWPEADTVQLRRKLGILNAYYLPGAPSGGHPSSIDDAITPVNSFRVVLDRYFGTDLGLLEDTAWVFESEQQLYDFTDVTNRVRGAG